MISGLTGMSCDEAMRALYELGAAELIARTKKRDQYALTDDGLAYAHSPRGMADAERFADRIGKPKRRQAISR